MTFYIQTSLNVCVGVQVYGKLLDFQLALVKPALFNAKIYKYLNVYICKYLFRHLALKCDNSSV